MRTILQKVLIILDGVPTVPQQSRRQGQSLVEMLFVMPFLIMMIAGIVEMGWFANNYLTLLEVTRVGARRGATLSGELSPIVWNDYASLSYLYDQDFYDVPLDPFLNSTYPRNSSGNTPDETQWPKTISDGVRWYTTKQYNDVNGLRVKVRNCATIGEDNAYVGFYNIVLCQMINSLTPITINPPDGDLTYAKFQELEAERETDGGPGAPTDDIVISVFSVKMINNTKAPCPVDEVHCANYDLSGQSEFEAGWNPVVVGRWPALANECNTYLVTDNNSGTPVIFDDHQNKIERDPFDYVSDGVLTLRKLNYPNLTKDQVINLGLPENYPIEWWTGEITNDETTLQKVGYDEPRQMEAQRGFAYTGYHRVQGPSSNGPFMTWDGQAVTDSPEAEWLCHGSEFSIYDMQDMLQSKEIPGLTNDLRQHLHDQGIVLVEIHYKHELLFSVIDQPILDINFLGDNFPLSPIFNILGGNYATISVWSAFPVPSAEPDLLLNMVSTDFYDPS